MMHPQDNYLDQSKVSAYVGAAGTALRYKYKQTISPYTTTQNKQLADTISRLDEIESNSPKKQELARLDKINCSELLASTGREIRCLNFQLQKLVSTD